MPSSDQASGSGGTGAGARGTTIALTGPTGYVGSIVGRHLESGGATVLPLSRRPDSLPGANAGRHYDLGQAPPVDLLRGCDALVHCAWDLSLVRPGPVWTTNVVGSQRLFDLARRSGLQRVVFVSSMSAYEGTAQLYGRSKLAAERAAADIGAAVVRLGLVVGPGWGGMAGALRRMVELPVTPVVSAAHQFTVREEDVGPAIERVLAAPSVPAVPLGVAHPDPVPFGRLLESIAVSVGARPRLVPVDWRLILAGLRLGELLHLPLPFRSDSLLGLVRPAPGVPNPEVVESLGIRLEPAVAASGRTPTAGSRRDAQGA